MMELKAGFAALILIMAQGAAAQSTPQGTKLAGAGTFWYNFSDDTDMYTVAISADGTTAVIGGWGTGSDTGSARVFTRSGDAWSRRASIPIGNDAVEADGPLYSVAISADGDTAVVGGPIDDSSRGAAWVFARSGAEWLQQGAKLIGEGFDGVNWQGSSVAISGGGETVLIGAPSAGGEGAAWIFNRSDGGWSQQGGPLVGSGGDCQSCAQGASVALSADGTTAIVGAPYARRSSGGAAGAAFVFVRSGEVWSQQGVLIGSHNAGASIQGVSVAISADGDTAVVGGQGDASYRGATWVFARHDGIWRQQGPKLIGSGSVGRAEQGHSVAISPEGDTIVVGGPGDNNQAGAAWVFTRSEGFWAQSGNTLSEIDGLRLGEAVALSSHGGSALVGSPGSQSGGAAWVYSFSSTTPSRFWVPVASHIDGFNNGHWRTDLGLLNTSASTSSVELRFHGSGGVESNSTYVPAGAQAILTDVVDQLGAEGQGALEIMADQELKVTVRTYNQSASDAGCFADSTWGQSYPAITAEDGLEEGSSAFLPSLVENIAYRTNIGLVNMGSGRAAVLVELFDGAGMKLTEYTVRVESGRWAQKNQPFRDIAGQTAMDRGYAKVTALSGSRVYALASVIDNVSNDPTAVAMQR